MSVPLSACAAVLHPGTACSNCHVPGPCTALSWRDGEGGWTRGAQPSIQKRAKNVVPSVIPFPSPQPCHGGPDVRGYSASAPPRPYPDHTPDSQKASNVANHFLSDTVTTFELARWRLESEPNLAMVALMPVANLPVRHPDHMPDHTQTAGFYEL